MYKSEPSYILLESKVGILNGIMLFLAPNIVSDAPRDAISAHNHHIKTFYSVQLQYPSYPFFRLVSVTITILHLSHSAALLIYFRLKLHPSVNLALPPVGWQST